ncbi:Hypothetical protein RG1141_CH10850 [Neorhizobium galegae bv. officinalis bv. officinalis str. HAMBI 1141]|uniref:Transmembrane protein n=1 Tax=Neorhizobium galegae bv. officinalis bv. officinalis str. HAMBI 1141 TaxID=1028801 RepID=A0A068T5T8_NEOGA|nr:membrane protein [Neorhizobium galegae]CDN53444.1 Hypothetical protein RG1141_CH10850 [Neorhizobium galegae bv. officinalis bv. officinalis str. HAMBI 1141]
MQYSTKARLLLAGAALSTFAGPAFALDGNDLVAKINGALSIQGGAGFSAEKATVSGSNVTLANAKLLVQAGKQNLPLGTVKFEGVEENNGGYTVEKVTFDNVNTSQDKTVFTASDIAISGLTVPGNPSGDGLDAIMLYDEAHIGKMTAAVDGKQAFSVDGMNLTTEVADDSSSVGFDLQINGVKSDLSLVDDAQAKDTLQQLGVTSIDGKVNMTGSWTLADGNLEIDEYAIDFAKVGKLNLAFSVSGYTLDFIKSANETAKAMEANPNKEEAQQAAGLAMLGLMQRLTFNSAEIRFEDAGITKKALDYAGKSQGTTGEAMAQMLKGMTPMMLAQYNVPELQNMVSAAVNTYLDKPGSFTITAEPADAVPFPMIMGAAMGAPNTLPNVLGVKVTAND